jgi:hypothetical protein
MEEDRTEEEKAAGTILMGFLSSLRGSYEDALRRKKPALSIANSESLTGAKKRPQQEDTVEEPCAKKQKMQKMPKSSEDSATATTDVEEKPQTKSLASVVNEDVKMPDTVPAKDKKKVSAPMSAVSSLADSYRQFTSASLQPRRNPPNYITDVSTSETSSGNNSTNPVESSLEDSDSNSDKGGDTNSDKGKDNPSSSEDDDKMQRRGRNYHHIRSKGPPRKRIKSKKMTDEMHQSAQEEKVAD